jgi:DNA (cytosine-5)-methyltransferase 1
MFTDYYNEIDPAASAWLAELVDDGSLPFGFVDCRDIKTVVPGDLTYYDQCHFFAGIGGWPLACKLAPWSGPIWTASLPCQPFSQAGAQRGTDDPRHLWPVFRDLVAQCLPPVLVGEQVASKAGRAWLAAVRADLEALGYAVGAADLCAAGIGAPHIRQRLYWVAHHGGPGLEVLGEQPARGQREAAERGREIGWLGHPDSPESLPGRGTTEALGHRDTTEPTGGAGIWRNPVWAYCADGKSRPLPRRAKPGAEPGADAVPPLVVRGSGEGVPLGEVDPDETAEARVMRLKGYGNAIVPELAALFLRAVKAALEPPALR